MTPEIAKQFPIENMKEIKFFQFQPTEFNFISDFLKLLSKRCRVSNRCTEVLFLPTIHHSATTEENESRKNPTHYEQFSLVTKKNVGGVRNVQRRRFPNCRNDVQIPRGVLNFKYLQNPSSTFVV